MFGDRSYSNQNDPLNTPNSPSQGDEDHWPTMEEVEDMDRLNLRDLLSESLEGELKLPYGRGIYRTLSE